MVVSPSPRSSIAVLTIALNEHDTAWHDVGTLQASSSAVVERPAANGVQLVVRLPEVLREIARDVDAFAIVANCAYPWHAHLDAVRVARRCFHFLDVFGTNDIEWDLVPATS